MAILRPRQPRQLLIPVKGHPFEREPFRQIFSDWEDSETTFVEQPAAAGLIEPGRAAPFSSILFYDMGGIDFTGPAPPDFVDPPEPFKRGLEALLAEGRHGIVILHHAAAAWPTWERWGEIVGARFFYLPGRHAGQAYPDSGYRHDVAHRVTPVDPGHPVVTGLGNGFALTDELYLWQLFDDDKTPLMRSDFSFTEDSFFSAHQAVQGKRHSRDGWTHPPGSDVIAWAKRIGPTRLVYIQCGDGPQTYENAGFRRLLRNAVEWVEANAI